MCHDHDSRPPAPPRSGDVAERGVLTLTSADGTEFSAAYAAPARPARVGRRGPARHPRAAPVLRRARRAVRRGRPAAAVAIDWFGRTAGVCAERGDPGRGLRLAAAHPADDARRGSTPTSPPRSATCASAPAATCRWSPSASASGAATPGGSPAATWTSPGAPASTASRRSVGRGGRPGAPAHGDADRRRRQARRWRTSCGWPRPCARRRRGRRRRLRRRAALLLRPGLRRVGRGLPGRVGARPGAHRPRGGRRDGRSPADTVAWPSSCGGRRPTICPPWWRCSPTTSDAAATREAPPDADGGAGALPAGVRPHRRRPGAPARRRHGVRRRRGHLQLTVLPGLARRGALRGQLEAVRVRPDHAAGDWAAAMIGWAVEEAGRHGCAPGAAHHEQGAVPRPAASTSGWVSSRPTRG